MKKLPVLLSGGLVLCGMGYALAAGGAEDPLVSLSYLNGAFADKLTAQIDTRLDASDAALSANQGGSSSAVSSSGWSEQCLNNGDLLRCSTGSSVLLLSGNAVVSFSSGAVIDVTQGTAVPSGTALQAQHRYLAAEDTNALFTVTSKTAVLDSQGSFRTERASGTTDYYAMASALKTLHLFQGSFTGYGQGFDLQTAPTRLQALIMFLRVLGEEQVALSWSGTMPFTDVDASSQVGRYVGYAYEMGYTKGYSATTFRPAQTITSTQYLEFLLRALGYSDGSGLSTTFDRALSNGVIGQTERSLLESGAFLRADLVYLSYYALDAIETSGGEPLSQVLRNSGIFTDAELETARASVTSTRLW